MIVVRGRVAITVIIIGGTVRIGRVLGKEGTVTVGLRRRREGLVGTNRHRGERGLTEIDRRRDHDLQNRDDTVTDVIIADEY